ncbi:hypothetical protein BGZ82_006079 [Podila clonocystis]|nr:hypothetical protein BGZ82_006079 [Podila clonocystis]
MRIAFSTVILSLVAATSVIAAPAPVTEAPPMHLSELEQRGWVMDKLKPLFQKAINSLQCGACVAALTGAKSIAYLNKNWVLDAANGICREMKLMDADVCSGIVYSQGPVLVQAALQANLLSGDGKMICFQALGICPSPGISSGTVSFPKPKPANAKAPAPSGKLVDVMHLSDWHVDAHYVPGAEAECTKPLCCRNYPGQSKTPKRAASTWGDYKCDAPKKLGIDMLKYASTISHPEFSIITGDIPPHTVWLETKETVAPQTKDAFDTIAAGLDTNVYPAIGNHEAGPTNLFPTKMSGGDGQWLYDALADDWSRWLPADAVKSVRNYGAYTASPAPGLRIMSLNFNFCYTMNFYLYGHTKDYDPNGQLKWFVQQLQAAEDAGERVWVIGHVGPSQTDCIQNWSHLYYQIIQRYSPHVIAEQFFGHTHYDEFSLFYGPGAKSAQNAISTAWIGPSVTPHTDLNPGFRVYKVDPKTWNVHDSLTYIADLRKAAQWDKDNTTPDWHLEYSAREAYGAYVPVNATEPLSASWWHGVTNAFEKNSTAFQTYWSHYNKQSPKMAACDGPSGCQREIICAARAGKSEDACTAPAFPLKREDEEDDAADATGMHSLYKRAEAKPWHKKQCGLTASY